MAAGGESEMSAAFPLGKPENNYTIEVIVKVMDAFMLSAETFFTVRVSAENYSRYNQYSNNRNTNNIYFHP